MKFSIFKFAALILFGILFLKFGSNVLADINSDCQNEDPAKIVAEGKTDTCTQILSSIASSISAANTTNQKNLAALQSQLNNLNSRISALSAQLIKTAADIAKREENMGFTQKVLEQKTRDHYTFLRLYDPITPFLFSDSASEIFQELSFRQKAESEDVNSIEQYVNEINNLKNSQTSLQKSQASLSVVQKQISTQTSFLAGEVAKANAYLATLSAKQEAFIAAKLESLGLSRSAYNMKGGCSSDINPYKPPNFSGMEFAFFTFGVPNRVGMNQFGAKGRAEAGQNAQDILKAYYNADYTTGYSQSINIHVVGTNEFGESINSNWGIEDYLTHLYEMPTDFPQEALRAQAIAARSFALAYTNNGAGSICPSQQCQVVKSGAHGSDAWTQAVHDTAGIVITSGGTPIKAWFSSTHGGYAYTSADIGWSSTSWTKRLQDTTGGVGSFSDLMNNAYDKSSPVFYCDWGSRSSENKTAWLSSTDLADIVNAILLVERDGSTKSHLYQTDKPNPEGTDTWDSGRVKSELGGSAFNTISDVSVGVDFGTGRTTNVTVSGDAATQTINGDDFKNYFNLRAPSNIQIVGPLFNVEKH
jgi:SpoIID/LytB domain protein